MRAGRKRRPTRGPPRSAMITACGSWSRASIPTRSPSRACSPPRATTSASQPPPPRRPELAREGRLRVEGRRDLDADPGPADIAYLDVWTPEVAPRVQRLRAQGTTHLVSRRPAARALGRPDHRHHRHRGQDDDDSPRGGDPPHRRDRRRGRAAARAPANLWPTADLLDRLRPEAAGEEAPAPPARADELAPRLHALEPDRRGRDLVLARPPRAARRPRPLPRRQGDDRAPPAPRRRRRRQRRRRLRRIRRRHPGRSRRVLARARRRARRLPRPLPPRHPRRPHRHRDGPRPGRAHR